MGGSGVYMAYMVSQIKEQKQQKVSCHKHVRTWGALSPRVSWTGLKKGAL